MSRESGGADMVLGFLLGIAAGAALALLFAPASGEQTRELLSETARKQRERAEDLAKQGREAWSRQRDVLTSAFERGREAFQQAKQEKEQA